MKLTIREQMRIIINQIVIGILLLIFSNDFAIANGTNKDKFNVLVFTKTTEYRHKSIPDGIELINKLGIENDFNVISTEDSEYFTDDSLSKFAAIIFLSTSGNILNEKQKNSFQLFINNGGGYVGIHMASATEYNWEWYGNLVGTFFSDHPKIQKGIIKANKCCHPSTIGLPQSWEWFDEWYNYKAKLNDNINVIASVVESTYEGGTYGESHPVIWCHEFDGGRSWYTSLGHTPESFSDSLFANVILGGIKYAVGYAPIKKLYLLDAFELLKVKTSLNSGREELQPAIEKLIQEAKAAMNRVPYSVMNKKFMPPSGDKHDYMSVGPYWWPNPDTEDGLPYIRNDGVVNPERDQYDRNPLKEMEQNVLTLAIAYYFTEYEPFAEQTSLLLKTWFLNDKTKMNPNLNYAQAIPGKIDGRGIGIIDTRNFGMLSDAVRLIENSKSWSENDTEKLVEWYSEFLEWLLNSENGKAESGWYNNHGTWFDEQAVHIALFVGRVDIAKKILNDLPAKRIDTQIDQNGSQPYELKRTRSFNYSTMNLDAFFRLGILAENVGINLWEYESKDGRSYKQALEYLIPYATGDKEWKYEMIKGWEDNLNTMCRLLRIASQKYDSQKYEETIFNINIEDKESNIINLIYPKVFNLKGEQ